jgi:hypothetical protein
MNKQYKAALIFSGLIALLQAVGVVLMIFSVNNILLRPLLLFFLSPFVAISALMMLSLLIAKLISQSKRELSVLVSLGFITLHILLVVVVVMIPEHGKWC